MGTVYSPSSGAPAPGVLLLGGSEGGLHERDARALASEGFTAMTLAYFGAPGLAPGLVDIPLEYFFRALDLLAEQPRVGDRLGLVGGSRGAEAGLLVAAHDERISAVVSVVGSGIVTQGIDFSRGGLLDILATPTNSWTLDGEPLPYLPNVITDELRDRVSNGAPVPLRLAFPPVPTDPAELERVSIPVEDIAGAVHMICVDDDQLWPSLAYSQVAIDRLIERSHPVEHRLLRGVGHPIAGPPGQPFSTTSSPGPGVRFAMGGTPEVNTAARVVAWRSTVRFLRRHLTGS